MASGDVDLSVRVRNAREAARDLLKVDASLGRAGRSADRAGRLAASGSRGFDRMARGVRGLAGFAGKALVGGLAAGGAAMAGFAYWVGKGAQSLQRIERIGAQTNAVIKSTGGVANVSRAGIDNLAGSLEALTGTEAESITEGANMLLTFTNIRNGAGKNNDIFNQSIRTLTDFSRAMDNTGQSTLDTRKQAIQMGKALNDPIKGITALSKVGVAFTEQQKKQITSLVEGGQTMKAQKIILAELNKEFGGSAKAFGATTTGKIERFKHAVGTAQETLAAAFAPALGKVSTQLVNKGVPALERFGRTFNRDVVPGVRAGIRETRALWRTYREDGIDGLVVRVENLTGTQGKLTPILSKAKGVLRDVGDIITGSLVPAFTDSEGAISAIISPLGHADDVIGFFADHADLTKNVIIGVVTALTLAKVATIGFTVYTKAAAVATGVHTAAVALSTSTLGTRIGVMALDAAAWVRSTAAVVLNTASIVAWRIVALAANVATKAWAAGQWLLNAAMLANPVGAVILAIGLLVGAFILAYKKSETFRGIIDGLWNDVLKPFGKFLGGVLIGYIRTVAVGWLSMGQFGVRAFRTLLQAAFKAFDGILAAAEAGMGWIPGLGGKIKDARRNFNEFGEATINKLKGVEEALGRARDRANELGRDRTARIDITTYYHSTPVSASIANDPTIARPGRRANGGPVAAGRPYVVGDGGRPELFVPEQNGRIVPRVPAQAAPPAMPAMSLDDLMDLEGADVSVGPGEGGTTVLQVILDGKVLTEAVVDNLTSRQARA